MLYEHRNSLLPKNLALMTIWGDDSYFPARSMDVFFRNFANIFLKIPVLS